MAGQNTADSSPIVESNYTVGQLISDLKNEKANIAHQPGVVWLDVLCDAAGGKEVLCDGAGGKLSSKWIEQKLAEFCLAEKTVADTANAMAVEEFAAWLAQTGANRARAARRHSEPSAVGKLNSRLFAALMSDDAAAKRLTGYVDDNSPYPDCKAVAEQILQKLGKQGYKAIEAAEMPLADLAALCDARKDGAGSGNNLSEEPMAVAPTSHPRNPAEQSAGVDNHGIADPNDTDEFEELTTWAKANLKGKQLRVVEMLIDGGGKKEISKLAEDPTISWEELCNNSWNSIKKALNKKLLKLPAKWELSTHNKKAVLSKIGQK